MERSPPTKKYEPKRVEPVFSPWGLGAWVWDFAPYASYGPPGYLIEAQEISIELFPPLVQDITPIPDDSFKETIFPKLPPSHQDWSQEP